MKWLIFITLKIVETVALLFVPLYSGMLVCEITNRSLSVAMWPIWLLGAWVVVATTTGLFLTGLLLVAGLPCLIDKNMAWAKDLAKWLNE